MIPIVALTSIAIFMVGLWLFGVVRTGSGVLATTREALAVIKDESLDDEARERAVQRASLGLFKAFGSIVVRSALALLSAIVPLWLADALGLAEMEAVVAYMSRWDVIIVVTVVLTVGWYLKAKLRSSQ